MIRASFVLALVLSITTPCAVGQELDSSALQKEAAQQAAPPAQPASQQPGQDHAPPPAAASPDQPHMSFSQATDPAGSTFMLPPGTKLPLGLLRPLTVKPGRDVYLQVTFPVSVNGQMLIPPGTYVQGMIDKLLRRDRRRDVLQFSIHSANLIFLNGYTVPIAGTITVGNARALPAQPPTGDSSGLPAMTAIGLAPPDLPPLPKTGFGNAPRNIMIAMGAITVVGITAGVLLSRHGDPEVETGTPLEIVLPEPVFLDAARVNSAVHQYDQHASSTPPQIVQPPKKPRPEESQMCYDPGSPGTPDTVISGSRGTPDTVIPGTNGFPDTVIPGLPATPDIVIPGTPGTPSSWYPCPKYQ
jgi:hypothetical protein